MLSWAGFGVVPRVNKVITSLLSYFTEVKTIGVGVRTLGEVSSSDCALAVAIIAKASLIRDKLYASSCYYRPKAT